MNFIKLKLVLPLIIFLSMSFGAFSQDLETQTRLFKNTDLLRKLQNNNNGESVKIESGIPAAESPNIQNTNNLSPKGNIVAESNFDSKAPSIIEEYFKILSGDDLTIYGMEEFSQGQGQNLLFFNTFGKEYVLAPGDVLRVSLRGFLELDGIHKVTRDGKIILPSLPPIDVVGFTTDDFESKLLKLLKLGDASASAFVSLDTGRLVTVQISGAVRNPRTVAVPAYTPLSRVLSYVGGVSDVGSLRNINLISNEGGVQRVDFYDFLQNPLGGIDPVITDNARIFVGDIGAIVAVSGFVSRAGIYELGAEQKKISVKALMKLSATNLLPPGAELEVLYFDNSGVPRSKAITIYDEINAGEVLNARFVNTRNINSISVRGAVVEPYDISTTEPQFLSNILKRGAVLSREAELSLAVIHGPDIEPYIIDINEIISNGEVVNPNTTLAMMKPNSTIYILSKTEYENLILSEGKQLKKIKDNRKFFSASGNTESLRLQPNIDEKIDLDQEVALSNLLISKKVNIYLDGKLNVVLAPNTKAIGEPKLASLATGFDVYPLYIGFNRYDEVSRAWSYLQLKAVDLFDEKFNVVFRKNDQLNFYSTKFINELGSEIVSSENILDLDQTVDLSSTNSETAIKTAFLSTDQGINALLKSARNVFGAVDRPGAYPIADSVTLSEILSVAGGTVDGADLSQIQIVQYKSADGRLMAGEVLKVNILNQKPAEVRLNGQFTIMVPFLINDAASGTITLSGEILQPGDYIFSRAETLQEIISKAGGLSNTAFPLGVVLSREAVKAQQRSANELLASEVEASVLQLSQSDISNSKGQVQAILGFAERLRNRDVSGRLTVNVLVSDPSAPVFLEDGDRVFVPKRPSYISVIGSVQKETMASYSSKNFFQDYIAAAGGMNSGADKKNVYVLLPNGESIKATRNIVIPPGSVVVVPPKTDKISVLGLTEIISRVMGNIATSVLAINNVK